MAIGAPQYGGFTATTATGNITLTAGDSVIQAIDPDGTSRDVTLPALGSTGQGKVVIDNTADPADASVLTIKDASANTLGTPAKNESAICTFSEGTWVCVVGAAN
jgi:hypothetical protein